MPIRLTTLEGPTKNLENIFFEPENGQNDPLRGPNFELKF